jgi:hypothetical protein
LSGAAGTLGLTERFLSECFRRGQSCLEIRYRSDRCSPKQRQPASLLCRSELQHLLAFSPRRLSVTDLVVTGLAVVVPCGGLMDLEAFMAASVVGLAAFMAALAAELDLV